MFVVQIDPNLRGVSITKTGKNPCKWELEWSFVGWRWDGYSTSIEKLLAYSPCTLCMENNFVLC